MSYSGEVVYPLNMQADDDHHDEVVDNQPQMDTIECIVKWFNPVKGYGFVVPKVGSEDIFLHFSVVDAAGFQHLGAGTELLCKVMQENNGRMVKEILEVRSKVEGFSDMGPSTVTNRSLTEMNGEVKWFNAIRGFGFIVSEDTDQEIFIHSSVLRRLGIEKLNPGDFVKMQVAITDQGPQAWSVSVLEEAEDELYSDDY